MNGIPYEDIDPEMIDILDVLNFDLGVKTKFCCIGHSPEEPTTIMFANSETDENMFKIASVVDGNVGICGVRDVKLHKWLRMSYQRYYKKPHFPQMNWILEIGGVKDYDRRIERLNKITEGLKVIKPWQ